MCEAVRRSCTAAEGGLLLALSELCECGGVACVCVYGCLLVCEYCMCACFIANLGMVFSQWCISC